MKNRRSFIQTTVSALAAIDLFDKQTDSAQGALAGEADLIRWYDVVAA